MSEKLLNMERLFVEVIDRLGDDQELFTTRSREGIFSPALTMWSMICQRTLGRKRLSDSIEGILNGDADAVISENRNGKRVQRKNISQNSGGISRARERLEVSVVDAVCRLITETVMQEGKGKGLWKGKRVVLFDGTVITLAHSPRNLEKYPPIKNQHGRAHSPLMSCMCCHELFSGAALHPQIGPYRGKNAVSEQELVYRMLNDLPQDCLIIADRNMGVFLVAYEAQKRGQEALLRLTSTRANHFGGKMSTDKEFIDEQIEWKPTTSYRKAHPELVADATIKGRVIKWTVKRNGYRPLPLMFFTTSSAPAEELVELYRQRERIENDIRSLKYTLGLEMLYSKTPEMVEKELKLGVASYNLIRAVIAQAAEDLGVEPRKISFSRAAGIIRIFGNQMRDADSTVERREIYRRLKVALGQVKLPNRTIRCAEPRKVVRKRQTFPLLRKSREQERKSIDQTLKKFGHRGIFTTLSRKY